jgi:Leucine-rich repeat (LRR) protein
VDFRGNSLIWKLTAEQRLAIIILAILLRWTPTMASASNQAVQHRNRLSKQYGNLAALLSMDNHQLSQIDPLACNLMIAKEIPELADLDIPYDHWFYENATEWENDINFFRLGSMKTTLSIIGSLVVSWATVLGAPLPVERSPTDPSDEQIAAAKREYLKYQSEYECILDKKSNGRIHVFGPSVPIEFTDDDLNSVPDLPFRFRLELMFAHEVTDRGLKNISRLKNLEGISLGHTRITNAGLKHLAGLKNLTALNLGYIKVSDDGAAILGNFKGLISLSLLDAPISDTGLKRLTNLDKLENLDLSHTKVTDEGLKCLKSFKSLTYVDLAGTCITDAGVKELAELKNVRELILGYTQVTESAKKTLAKALPKCLVVH